MQIYTLSRSGISSLEVTSPISLSPTFSGMTSVIIYKYNKDSETLGTDSFNILLGDHLTLRNETLCRIAFDLLASFPPFNKSPFPLRIANAAIYTARKKESHEQ